MKRIEGGVTAPKGFLAAGLNAGIKNSDKKDMAMIYSQVPCRDVYKRQEADDGDKPKKKKKKGVKAA